MEKDKALHKQLNSVFWFLSLIYFEIKCESQITITNIFSKVSFHVKCYALFKRGKRENEGKKGNK